MKGGGERIFRLMPPIHTGQLDRDQPTTSSLRQNKITRLIAWGNVILNGSSN